MGVRRTQCLLLLNDPCSSMPDRPRLLKELWELTDSEIRLALAIAGGQTIAEYSEREGVSKGTARWHLKNIQTKTNTRSIEAVVGLMHSVLLRL